MSTMLLSGCETKEYYPDINAERDVNLFGTWRFVDSSPQDSSLYVFTSDGYVGSSYFVDNDQIYGFTNLYLLWKNVELIGADGWGKIYVAETSSSWQKMRSENEEYYKLSENNDTLYLAYIDLKTKESDKDSPSILVRNDYQLLFDGPFFIEIDTLQYNNQE